MYPELYDKEGRCVRCKGTNKCHSCGGSGRRVLEEDSVFPEGTEVPCPTCFGGGDCKFCHGKKRKPKIIKTNDLARTNQGAGTNQGPITTIYCP
ncbi:MAG: hypothetical protein A2V72_02940 [Candidatus Nealsonbacteria bacterium RBG_13_37_56]|uniref:Uncharacterized protein n=1 Tax=Candidatus Nealsonbacteria bacterium RBG_13_37_56 TaxID=1801661 RepID=A0A1G2DWE2_9BACT|nr:MAG: hypothetical protein A2V72_02940 [Candidatus Nealsonbacteria bacterium RBG_13_37_56]OGZ34952.1 MAG: hypothetical protein A2V60_02235 [Candidatus Portnoybacteria bacterium RIFCSPHIGHO2_01_FULL_39_19]